MSFHENAIFWIEVNKIYPNPYQPRREFDEQKLFDLADSIRQYGVLQPLVVTRQEKVREDGGMDVGYELIAGERRLRAARIAGVEQVPVVVRAEEDDDGTKLELAIIENLQREDLNAIDRARAFDRLSQEFGYKHHEIGKKVGRSREYVTNSIRVLGLPEEMQAALMQGKITEGHTRPLLMLTDRPDEQNTLFKEILLNKMKVRDAEAYSRRIAVERARKIERMIEDDILELGHQATAALGTPIGIEADGQSSKIIINCQSDDEVRQLLTLLNSLQEAGDENEFEDEDTSAFGTEDESIFGIDSFTV